MKARQSAFFALLLLAPASFAGAEGRRLEVTVFPKRPVAGRDVVVEVVVRDAATGKPVEGAVVRLSGQAPGMGVEVEGRTRDRGRVRLPLPARRGGPLVVEALAVGYEPARLAVFVNFRRLPPSAVVASLAGFLAFWGGLLLCVRRVGSAASTS